jgi:hypothetical protein
MIVHGLGRDMGTWRETKRLLDGASFSPDRLHNRPEAARYLLTLVTACSDRDTHTLSKFS